MEIDLNCDLGEGFGAWQMGNDAALLDLVSSANIACGFHAGDPRQMQRTVAAAVERGVAIGAHIAYPDRVGFGRRAMQLTAEEIRTDTLYQLGALQAFASAAGSRVRYVKPHGALYHRIAQDDAAAAALLQAIKQFDAGLPLVTLPGSAAQRVAQADGIRVITEAFADRAYQDDGSLLPRSEAGAVIHQPEQVVARVLRLIGEQKVHSHSGKDIALKADTLCVHGDTEGALELTRQLRQQLEAAGVTIKAFA